MRPTRHHRGAAVAVLILLLAAINIAVVAAVTGSGRDADVALLRVQTLRALHAADSGAIVALATYARGETPLVGASLPLTAAESTVLAVPGTLPGDLTIEGVSGEGRRRLTLQIE